MPKDLAQSAVVRASPAPSSASRNGKYYLLRIVRNLAPTSPRRSRVVWNVATLPDIAHPSSDRRRDPAADEQAFPAPPSRVPPAQESCHPVRQEARSTKRREGCTPPSSGAQRVYRAMQACAQWRNACN